MSQRISEIIIGASTYHSWEQISDKQVLHIISVDLSCYEQTKGHSIYRKCLLIHDRLKSKWFVLIQSGKDYIQQIKRFENERSWIRQYPMHKCPQKYSHPVAELLHRHKNKDWPGPVLISIKNKQSHPIHTS